MVDAAPGWLPAYFTGDAAVALRAGVNGRTIGQMGGQVIEGWRASGTPGALGYDPLVATTPVYRQGNIEPLRLQPSGTLWSPPGINGDWCVRPGDVVLSKFAPVRAAFVSPAARRHPVDGNTLIVSDLPRAVAAWVAVCLNQPGYERLLLLGTGLMDRVGMKALASLRLPAAPPDMEGLSARLADALDDELIVAEPMRDARAAAEQMTSPGATVSRPVGEGSFFSREAMSTDNWLPRATGLRAELAQLAAALGWRALGELATTDDRARLMESPDHARVLRIGDVGDDLFAAVGDDAAGALIPSRTLAGPLVPGDVLLSTFGFNLRAAYVDEGMSPHTFPSDGWARFRFRDTPAAWALLLSTDAIRAQAGRLAIGSVQQFVPVEALRTLRLPVPPAEILQRWQRTVERYHAQRRAQQQRWSALVNELNALFEATHRPFARTSPGAQESES